MLPMPLVMLIIWIGMPLLIAAYISYAVRMPEFTRRIAWVVYSIAFCVWAMFPFTGVFKLGIDLSGGTILTYQVKQPAQEDFSLDKMVVAIQRRVNPIGMTDVTIRGIGADRVEIIIPKAGRLHHKSLPQQDFFKVGLVPACSEAFVLDAHFEC